MTRALWRDQIERLMKGPGLRARLAEAGYAYVSREFSEEQFGGRFYHILRGLPKREIAWDADLEETMVALTGREFTDFVCRSIAVNKALKTLRKSANLRGHARPAIIKPDRVIQAGASMQ